MTAVGARFVRSAAMDCGLVAEPDLSRSLSLGRATWRGPVAANPE